MSAAATPWSPMSLRMPGHLAEPMPAPMTWTVAADHSVANCGSGDPLVFAFGGLQDGDRDDPVTREVAVEVGRVGDLDDVGALVEAQQQRRIHPSGGLLCAAGARSDLIHERGYQRGGLPSCSTGTGVGAWPRTHPGWRAFPHHVPRSPPAGGVIQAMICGSAEHRLRWCLVDAFPGSPPRTARPRCARWPTAVKPCHRALDAWGRSGRNRSASHTPVIIDRPGLRRRGMSGVNRSLSRRHPGSPTATTTGHGPARANCPASRFASGLLIVMPASQVPGNRCGNTLDWGSIPAQPLVWCRAAAVMVASRSVLLLVACHCTQCVQHHRNNAVVLPARGAMIASDVFPRGPQHRPVGRQPTHGDAHTPRRGRLVFAPTATDATRPPRPRGRALPESSAPCPAAWPWAHRVVAVRPRPLHRRDRDPARSWDRRLPPLVISSSQSGAPVPGQMPVGRWWRQWREPPARVQRKSSGPPRHADPDQRRRYGGTA